MVGKEERVMAAGEPVAVAAGVMVVVREVAVVRARVVVREVAVARAKEVVREVAVAREMEVGGVEAAGVPCLEG
eukprot:scaffold2295_cov354-Prasinococcus_capsulatus_cf.AAC.17